MYIGNPLLQSAFLVDTFSGNNSTTVFTMSVAPANTASVLVAVSGVLQDPSTYSVVGTTLTFTQAPPTGTGNISARYLGIPASGVTTTAYRTVTTFTATASQTTFTPPSYTVGFINVYRNGVLLTPTSDYTASNGTTVVLASGAASGDTVIVESFLVSSVLNAIPNTAASVSQSNLASGVAGTGPAFSVYQSSGQTISSGTYTKIQFQTKEYDTANAFDATTNYRFQPTVAGYYSINGGVGLGTATGIVIIIYKNGSSYKNIANTYGLSAYGSYGAGQVYLNGSTDYIELYVYLVAGETLSSGSLLTYFQGYLARSA